MANKIKSYTETELIDIFGLTRLWGNAKIPLMQDWTDASVVLTPAEHDIFEEIYTNAAENIIGWQEEDLKMLFISPVLFLAQIKNTKRYLTFFERTIEGTINGHYLKTKTDFMVASGSVGIFKVPYFHFQEYKPFKNPSGDSMGQLLEAMLIAQQKNDNGKPIYGCEIIGKYWSFVIMQHRTYCVSDAYDCTKKADLMQIIAILRKFKYILDTELIDK